MLACYCARESRSAFDGHHLKKTCKESQVYERCEIYVPNARGFSCAGRCPLLEYTWDSTPTLVRIHEYEDIRTSGGQGNLCKLYRELLVVIMMVYKRRWRSKKEMWCRGCIKGTPAQTSSKRLLLVASIWQIDINIPARRFSWSRHVGEWWAGWNSHSWFYVRVVTEKVERFRELQFSWREIGTKTEASCAANWFES